MSSSGFDMSASGLHQAGRTTSGRSAGAGASSGNLKTGLDAASGRIGNNRVKSRMSAFVTNRVVDSANRLPVAVESGGINVSNVASVARDDDNEKASRMAGPIGGSTGISGHINRKV